ncbi:hypothetical protein [Pedobacter gandavensis]|uniref:hypothetical protein n=1 Tax=Pedobacter gandavensis TaxID=2679963 RepID=UPI0029301E4E|nr:hypothetical protein [Pedobacter gandavensis]
MKREVFTLFCIAHCFSACSLFQKTSTSTLRSAMKAEEKSVRTAQLKSMNQSLGWSLSVRDDSLNSSSTVVIWPKGEFSFSPLTGFSGMADRVMITGTLKSGQQMREEKVQLQKQAETIAIKAINERSVERNQKEKIKERFPISGWWLVLLLIPLFFVLKRIKSRIIA